MKILVVGGFGFIGSRIMKILKGKGFEAYSTCRNLNNMEISRDFDSLVIEGNVSRESIDFDVIINAAGFYSNSRSLADIQKNIESNASLTIDIAKFISPKTKRLVHLSSYFEYAPNLSGHVWSQYAASKILGRITLEKICMSLSTQFVSCVLYDNYCEDLSRGKFVDHLIKSCWSNSEFTVYNLNNEIDLIDLEYLVEKIIEVAVDPIRDSSTTFQIRSNEVFTTGEIIEMAKKIKKVRIIQEEINQNESPPKATGIWDSAPDWPSSRVSKHFQDYLIKMLNTNVS